MHINYLGLFYVNHLYVFLYSGVDMYWHRLMFIMYAYMFMHTCIYVHVTIYVIMQSHFTYFPQIILVSATVISTGSFAHPYY